MVVKESAQVKIDELLSRRVNISQLTFEEGKPAIIAGFLREIRDCGKMIFLKISDDTGSIQVLLKDEQLVDDFNSKKESILVVEGKLQSKKSTDEEEFSEWEILCLKIKSVNTSSKDALFSLNELTQNIDEELRLQYRYLDLRRPSLHKNIKLRSKIKNALSSFLIEQGFDDIDTPVLSVNTREGAATFSTFIYSEKDKYEFSLSQSPQFYKQLSMMGSFEKYFQFAKVFRREDLRSDRQFEFTQLDLEVSYKNQKYLFDLIEKMMHSLNKKVFDKKLKMTFTRLTYDDAYSKYGSDKPDLRYDWKFIKIAEIDNDLLKSNMEKDDLKKINKEEWEAFAIQCDEDPKTVNYYCPDHFQCKALLLPKNGSKEDLFELLSIRSLKYKENLDETRNSLIVFSTKSQRTQTLNELWKIRQSFIEKINLQDKRYKNQMSFVWITDWPLFEWNETQKKHVIAHHLFTKPDHDNTTINVEKDGSMAYDLVLNGTELASGSQRINDIETQLALLKAGGLSKEEIDLNFGWFLEAFKYGVPPHMGIGIGFDRLMQKLLNTESIRDVIAFPKNTKGFCKMTNSPHKVK